MQHHWRRKERNGDAWFLFALAVLIVLSFASAAAMEAPERSQHADSRGNLKAFMQTASNSSGGKR